VSVHRDPRIARITQEVLARLRAAEHQRPRSEPPRAGGPIASLIDHTLLRPEATADDIIRIANEARAHGFAAVCVNPTWVALAAQRLAGSPVKVAAVVGFPLGAMHSEIKALEARRAHALGAQEIDMVIDQGALAGDDVAAVTRDVACVRRALGRSVLLKVILETGRLDPASTRAAARAAVEGGADYLKTSTGFGAGGATVESVRILREVAGTRVGVKASGGIRNLADARALVEAGATRLGASSGVAIAREEQGLAAAPPASEARVARTPGAY